MVKGDSTKSVELEIPVTVIDINNLKPTIVGDIASLKDTEKNKVKAEVIAANDTLSLSAQVNVGNDGSVTITYADKTTDTLPSEKTVKSMDNNNKINQPNIINTEQTLPQITRVNDS